MQPSPSAPHGSLSPNWRKPPMNTGKLFSISCYSVRASKPETSHRQPHMDARMFTHTRIVRIEWGDCDPAGIVFYPRYFAMFDHSTVLLIEAALGMNKHALYGAYAFDGYPVVETRARFFFPTRYGDDVSIETALTKVGRSSFRLRHRLSKDGALAVEAQEARVWVVRDRERSGRLKPQPLPADVVARFTGATARP
jgi:4-hydroxybenzoyl-CoA thioesterase